MKKKWQNDDNNETRWFFLLQIESSIWLWPTRRDGERPLIKFVEIATITLTISVRPCLMALNDGEGRKYVYIFPQLWMVYSCVHFFFLILVFSTSVILVLAHSFLFYVSFCFVRLIYVFCFAAYISYLRAHDDEKRIFRFSQHTTPKTNFSCLFFCFCKPTGKYGC